MTDDEKTAALVRKLRRLARSTDPEAAHADADEALLAFIDSEKVTSAYNSVPKWYA